MGIHLEKPSEWVLPWVVLQYRILSQIVIRICGMCPSPLCPVDCKLSLGYLQGSGSGPMQDLQMLKFQSRLLHGGPALLLFLLRARYFAMSNRYISDFLSRLILLGSIFHTFSIVQTIFNLSEKFHIPLILQFKPRKQ